MSARPRDADAATLLGAPRITVHGVTHELAPERRFQLLALLACRGDWATRDALAGMFWPDHDNAAARRNLRFVLHSLRALPHLDILDTERDRVRLRVRTDVAAFESAVQAGRWAEALALYRGPLCAGLDVHANDGFVQWLGLERARLAALFHRAATEQIAASEPAARIPIAERLLEVDANDEDALRVLLGALGALGRLHEAKQVYRDFAARLMDDLGLEPSAATRAVARESAAADEPVEARAAPGSFVGRDEELRQIAALVAQDDCRLLTLLGAGGVGKSRLAREVAATSPRSPTWVVDLQAVTVPAHVATQTATVLGIRPSRGAEADAQVAAFIGERAALLVLDQFEHVIDAAQVVARWLDACPRLTVLVTSRERLDIANEWIVPLTGLPCPAPQARDAETFDAVRLFVARAQAAVAGFRHEKHQPAIADIVRRVEGLPLAIELAAAWVRYLPCEEIARDLANALEQPDGGRGTRAAHRSIRASCEYSWSMLTARERTWFARLAVFRRTFSADAGRHVAQATLPALAGLVDKSLLRAHEDGRFSLHPLMHAFAHEKLACDAEEAANACERHAEYFAHWLARFNAPLRSQMKADLSEVDVEVDNCVAAWGWAIAHQRGDLVRDAAIGLMRFFEIRGRLREGLDCFEQSTALDVAAAGDDAAGLALRGRATLSLRLGLYDAAETLAREALHHLRRAGDSSGIKGSLTVLGLANWERARYAQARPYFVEGLRRARADADAFGIAAFQTNLALIAKAAGDYAEAAALLDDAIPLYRDAGDEQGRLTALSNLGNLYRSMKQPARGRAPLLEALAGAQAAGLKLNVPFILLNLALVELDVGDLDAAAAYGERALRIVEAGADRQAEIATYATLARVAIARGDVASARARLRSTALLARETRHVPHLVGVAALLGAIQALENRPVDAAAVMLLVSRHPSAGGPDRDEANALLSRLDPLLSPEDRQRAAQRAATLDLDLVVGAALAADLGSPGGRPD